MGFVALVLLEGTEGGLDEAVDEDDPFESFASWTFNSKELLAAENVGVFGGGTFGLSFGDTSLSVFFPSPLNSVEEEEEEELEETTAFVLGRGASTTLRVSKDTAESVVVVPE